MKAQIISIGDEILIGDTINTNAAFIGNLLVENQIKINRISVVGDDENAIISELDYALSKLAENDIVITTGGLGPTNDDITFMAIAKYFNCNLVLNNEVLESIKQRFKKLDRTITPSNEKQAYIPEVAIPLINRFGTAPGLWIEHNDKILISLPGVPSEMEMMMKEQVIPKLNNLTKETKASYLKKLYIMTIGIPESFLYERLGNLDELLEGCKLAFLPSPAGVKLRITAESDNEKNADDLLQKVEQKIRGKVGRFIYGKNNEDLADIVGRLLKDRALTISVAESCTGGLISNLITNFSGSSNYYERGIVAYSNAAKVELLKVNEDLITQYGTVSLEVARQMAEGIRAISGTDIGLSITGIMGPTGATTDKPIGLTYIGYCDNTVCTAYKFIFGDNRINNKIRASYTALDILRKHILGIPIET
ncbi:MAG: competence/damage-inducible protein A [Ignavibacterium sp.]